MTYRNKFKAGDLVKYYDFSEGNHEYDKPRPAMVLGYDPYKRKFNVMRITSKNEKTETEDYRLLGDEIRIPSGMKYEKNGMKTHLYGVIKTNNIIQVDRERLTQMLDVFSFEFKKDVLDKYSKLHDKKWYSNYADSYCQGHHSIMNYFREDLVAEKLGYFDDGVENIYDFLKYKQVGISGITQLASNSHGYRYSVLMEVDDEVYEHTFSTSKNETEVVTDWQGSKSINEWLKEDRKYHVLKRDLSVVFSPDEKPVGNYKSVSKFKKDVQKKNYCIEY